MKNIKFNGGIQKRTYRNDKRIYIDGKTSIYVDIK